VGGTREPGGVHIHTADVAQAASDLGCQVTIVSITIDFFSSLFAPGQIPVEVVDRLCIERQIDRPYRTAPRRYQAWLQLIARHRGSDIVLVHGSFGQTPLGELILARLGARRLYTIEHSPGIPRRESRPMQRLYGAAMGLAVHRAIAVSEGVRDVAVEGFGVPASKVAVCNNWVGPSFRPPGPAVRAAARSRLELAEDAIAIGYVGRLSGDKRGETLLRAFAEALAGAPREARLIMAGDGWKADDWRDLARSLGIARRVQFTGWVSDAAAVYDALDAFVLPSLVEGFPLGVMEAMASGVPCMVHPMGSTLALVENGVTGFVQDMATPTQLAGGLKMLMAAAPGRLRSMGVAAAAHIAGYQSREARLPAVLEALDIPLGGRLLPPAQPRILQFRPWDAAP
jgi:glycosyltransferase involved in cell wall biosynthesis